MSVVMPKMSSVTSTAIARGHGKDAIEASTNAMSAVSTLNEIPHFFSSKFPTLKRAFDPV